MHFERCPECALDGLEVFDAYDFCHDCGYFTVRHSRYVPPPPPHLRGAGLLGLGERRCGIRFTTDDYQIVRRAMQTLPLEERRVVFLRFWGNRNENEIADALGVRTTTVKRLLKSSFQTLLDFCRADPRFSRTKLSNSTVPKKLAA